MSSTCDSLTHSLAPTTLMLPGSKRNTDEKRNSQTTAQNHGYDKTDQQDYGSRAGLTAFLEPFAEINHFGRVMMPIVPVVSCRVLETRSSLCKRRASTKPSAFERSAYPSIDRPSACSDEMDRPERRPPDWSVSCTSLPELMTRRAISPRNPNDALQEHAG